MIASEARLTICWDDDDEIAVTFDAPNAADSCLYMCVRPNTRRFYFFFND